MRVLRIRNLLSGILLVSYCHLFLSYFGLYTKHPLDTTELTKKIEIRRFNAKTKTEKVDFVHRLRNNLFANGIKSDVAISQPTSVPVVTDKYEHLIDWTFPLKYSVKSPKPAFKQGKLNGSADFIIGIPSVKRDRGDYLMDTLHSLVNNRRSKTASFKIVIFLGEVNLTYVKERSQQVYNSFTTEFDKGRMQIISPPKEYYPDWNVAITNTLGDSLERVKWRSKENLDAVFIMMYIYQLSTKYYLMLEDDVKSDVGYDEVMEQNTKRLENSDWFFISYCGWCSIGKLFRKESIPSFAGFVHTFWNKKPIDWLQGDYTRTAYCTNDGDELRCQREFKKRLPAIEPYVFHHVGKFSSLKGKVLPIHDRTKNSLQFYKNTIKFNIKRNA